MRLLPELAFSSEHDGSFRGWCFANGSRRRRTEAGARSRSFVFCALDSRQLSFIQPVYPRQLSLVAYKTPLTPAKNELLTRATSASIRRQNAKPPSLYRPRKASPPLMRGLADVMRRRWMNVACHCRPLSPRVRYIILIIIAILRFQRISTESPSHNLSICPP